MTDACKEYYNNLFIASNQVMEESFSELNTESMAKGHAFIADLSTWCSILDTRPEVMVLQSAIKEYQYSLLTLSTGQYRSSFASLRLTLELAFATVQWSANERELREWLRGERDGSWASLIDPSNGILSKSFVRLFSEILAEEAPRYRASASAVYRECSEFVHGNAHTHQLIPDQLVFDKVLFDAWHTKASVVRLVISFALVARYLGSLSPSVRPRLESIISDQLGHSPGIQTILGQPAEAYNG
ncbi:MAG: hypothetical protein P4L50_06015 [Anaerolineaceae bacterium]|nr:hypothetical protein [Anaerolineaceae bacterium]